MSVAAVIGVLALATLEGALVGLPREGAFAALVRVRSPAWAALLPGAIVVGTFAPLWHEALATALVLGAAITAPPLAVVGLVGVVRGRRAVVSATGVTLAAAVAVAPATVGQLAVTGVTALAALSVGVALTRLIPWRWLVVGVVLMAAADVLLLGAGAGRSAAGSMATAGAGFHGPQFTQASVGPAVLDYPDLVLGSVLGGVVAGSPLQRRAAVAVAVLGAATGMLLTVVPMVPETIPVAVTFGLLAIWRRAPPTRPERSLGVRAGLPVCRHLVPQPCPHGCA